MTTPTAAGRRGAAARAALLGALFGVAGATACDVARERPLPFAADEPIQLTVEVVAPLQNELGFIGEELVVRVRGSEPRGRLTGLGFTAKRSGPGNEFVASRGESFTAVADTAISFTVTLPSTLPTNVSVNIFGVAHGPDGASVETPPRGIIVVECSPQATWCQ